MKDDRDQPQLLLGLQNLPTGVLPNFDSLKGVMSAIEQNKKMVGTLGLTMNNLQQIGTRLPALHEELQGLSRAVKAFESSFRLPEPKEFQSIVDQLQNMNSAAIHALNEQVGVHQMIASMKNPWLSADNAERSLKGLSELYAIGKMTQTLPVFDDQITNHLRIELGDWQHPIAWSDTIFENPVARVSFYKEKGLDSSLTDFPTETFDEGLVNSGLKDNSEYLDEEGLNRTNQAHRKLTSFEIAVRNFIKDQMQANYGQTWIRERISGSMRDAWINKKAKAKEAGEPERHLIDYADFTDYVQIISRKDNWNDMFKPIFKRESSIQESFQRLHPIRICTMHARPITQDDELYLYVETKRILKAIGIEN